MLNYRNLPHHNNYKCNDTKLNNVKQITKYKISPKDDNLKKRNIKFNELSKISVAPRLEAKLSFLSSLSSK